jgi:hypothetical protein
MILVKVILPVGLLVLTGCSTPVVLTPVVGDRQSLEYYDGQPKITSKQSHTVELQIRSSLADTVLPSDFGVGVYLNYRVRQSLEFSSENIKASAANVALKTFSSDELVSEAQRRLTAERVGLPFQGFDSWIMRGEKAERDCRDRNDIFAVAEQVRPDPSSSPTPAARVSVSRIRISRLHEPEHAIDAREALATRLQEFGISKNEAVCKLEQRVLRRLTLTSYGMYQFWTRIELPAVRGETERMRIYVEVPPELHTFEIEVRRLRNTDLP